MGAASRRQRSAAASWAAAGRANATAGQAVLFAGSPKAQDEFQTFKADSEKAKTAADADAARNRQRERGVAESDPIILDVRNLGKAGRSRWLGIRPTVRGSVMNPLDHPYGGGEGRQGRGTRRPKTAQGKITGGRKTRNPNKKSAKFIIRRRQK